MLNENLEMKQIKNELALNLDIKLEQISIKTNNGRLHKRDIELRIEI